MVSSERGQIRDILIVAANPAAEKMGIDIVDVRIMRVELPSEVSSSVFRRMESERARVARITPARAARKWPSASAPMPTANARSSGQRLS